MFIYKVKLFNGGALSAGISDTISIIIVGVNGQTMKHQLNHRWKDFFPGSVNEYEIHSKEDVGEILLVRLFKERYKFFPESPWFCKKITVTCPSGVSYQFPYYQWITGYVMLEIPEGKGIILSGDINPLIIQQRRMELQEKRRTHSLLQNCASNWVFLPSFGSTAKNKCELCNYVTMGVSTCATARSFICGVGWKIMAQARPSYHNTRCGAGDSMTNLCKGKFVPNCRVSKCHTIVPLNFSLELMDCSLPGTGKEVEAKFEMMLQGYKRCTKSWTDLGDIKKLFVSMMTVNSDLVSELWKEDTFFGYQYLNGVNPVIIQKCIKIPDNFPVDDEMVAPSLGLSTNLRTELQNGNIFLADYQILQGVPANIIDDQQQYLAAPLCLLWKTPQNYIIPIAIQLGQTPGKTTPIFLPSDSDLDWTLAKIWVRNAELQVHEGVSHLLYTHLFAEVFNIATTRQLPMGHPVYKLIIPHIRYTLQVNVLARNKLIGPGGTLDWIAGSGKGGITILLRKAMEKLTYTALCLPEDIKIRGTESLPNYFYRNDAMSIWTALESFISDIVHYYYKDDDSVSEDPELQAWVGEIFKEGFLDNQSSGIPSSLKTQAELIKYLTMVIFTCSARHAAFSIGQFDFYSWMPNGPSTLRTPPLMEKGSATFQTVLDTLPPINITVISMALVCQLSHEPKDRSPGPRAPLPYRPGPGSQVLEEGPERVLEEGPGRSWKVLKVLEARSWKVLKVEGPESQVLEATACSASCDTNTPGRGVINLLRHQYPGERGGISLLRHQYPGENTNTHWREED
ncbi:hydroperoxide isomerase ALOXE3-like [Pelobates cultripes]|uniref:Hydroperoxide isomerase ALOXE3-like n=1 Tax=Pelobates cultripes TaxID=61616 RepID=A0AAD1VQV2_PELCU|nr:hydroperoxide isomerase ALOXE3-like [Pelobates cultripes]